MANTRANTLARTIASTMAGTMASTMAGTMASAMANTTHSPEGHSARDISQTQHLKWSVCTELAGGWGLGAGGCGLGLVIVDESGQFHSTHRLRPWCRRGAEARGPQPICQHAANKHQHLHHHQRHHHCTHAPVHRTAPHTHATPSTPHPKLHHYTTAHTPSPTPHRSLNSTSTSTAPSPPLKHTPPPQTNTNDSHIKRNTKYEIQKYITIKHTQHINFNVTL